MCAGLSLREMNRLKAVIKALDVKSLTLDGSPLWRSTQKVKRMPCDSVHFDVFPHIQQERLGTVYATRERSRNLAGNEPIKASD